MTVTEIDTSIIESLDFPIVCEYDWCRFEHPKAKYIAEEPPCKGCGVTEGLFAVCAQDWNQFLTFPYFTCDKCQAIWWVRTNGMPFKIVEVLY